MVDSKDVEVFDKLRGILNNEVLKEVLRRIFKRQMHLFFDNSCVLM